MLGGGEFCLLFRFVGHLHEIHTSLQSDICRLLPSGQCVNLWAFDSYSGVLQLFCFMLLLLELLAFSFFLIMWSVCLCVLLCA